MIVLLILYSLASTFVRVSSGMLYEYRKFLYADASAYRNFLYSYNIPELTRTKVEASEYKISSTIKDDAARQVEFR